MRAHSLLERVRRPELAAPRRAVTDDEVRASVLSNLRSMCATWLGSSRSSPDYGIVCVSDIVHSCPEALGLVAKAIRHTITVYEPRLTNVVVRPLPSGPVSDVLTLRFDISATLANDARRVPVKFHTVVDASRNVQVILGGSARGGLGGGWPCLTVTTKTNSGTFASSGTGSGGRTRRSRRCSPSAAATPTSSACSRGSLF